MEDRKKKSIVVLGAGVVGLTTALTIKEQGQYDVTIIAEVLPSDPKTVKYTSRWAAAHHLLNVTEEERQQKIDIDSLPTLWELSEPESAVEECFLRGPQTELYCTPDFPSLLHHMPDHKEIPRNQLPPGVVNGYTFTTVNIDVPKYIPYLVSRFTASGGRFLRGSVQHIQQVVEGGANLFSGASVAPSPPDAVIVCTGLGTRFLGGVEDKNVYPVRGQTVLIRAPWIKFGISRFEADGTMTYVIPRRSGDIILGGTRDVDDWFPRVRPETSRDIIERAFKLCPELAPPEIREKRAPTLEDILPIVIEEGCGFRPARKGGLRLEVEWLEAGKSGQKVPIVFNYGHGGYGFQSSWGSADIVMGLLEEVLKDTTSH